LLIGKKGRSEKKPREEGGKGKKRRKKGASYRLGVLYLLEGRFGNGRRGGRTRRRGGEKEGSNRFLYSRERKGG